MAVIAEHWKSGVFWLIWNLVGMLGLWATGGLIFFFLDNPPWFELIDRGQFFLYSVGVLGQVMYILNKERKITKLPLRSWISTPSVVCLLVCTVLFSGTVLSDFTDITVGEQKISWLRWAGLGTFLASLSIGLVAAIAAEDRQGVDMEEIGKRNYRRLEARIPDIEDKLP